MTIKKVKREDTQHVGLRMPSKLVEKIDEIYYSNKTDRSTEIIRACEEYVAKYFPEDSEKISKSSGNVEGADLREEVLDFFRSDEGRELEKMKKEE
jgi:metal-responsive CopG/Arc/MetJ family transcriptional regulator